MILRHFRHNAVAYLALLIALTTGTAYAAGVAPGSVKTKSLAKNAVTSPKIKDGAVISPDIGDGAVTSPKIADGAVTSPDIADGAVTSPDIADGAVTSPKIVDGAVNTSDVADGSLSAADLQPGTLPVLPVTFLATEMLVATTPGASPDTPGIDPFAFTLPAAGTIYLSYFSAMSGITCSSGTGEYGVYVDGAPVPLSGHAAPTFASARALTLTATTALAAGPHTLTFGFDCPSGTVNQSTRVNTSWTVLTLGA
jgi:hypothetical protein